MIKRIKEMVAVLMCKHNYAVIDIHWDGTTVVRCTKCENINVRRPC